MSLFDSASVVITPSGYKEDKLYSIKPTDGSGDLVVTRATTATRVNSAGLVELVPYNLLSYSEDFSNVFWTKLLSTITSNAIAAPNGTLTADKLVEDTSNGVHRCGVVSAAGLNGTFSFYAKSGERTKIAILSTIIDLGFDLSNGTLINIGSGTTGGSIESVGNGWYRCSLYQAINIQALYFGLLDNSGNVSYTGNGTSGAYFWGAQLVTGSSAKEYFPTTDRLNVPRIDYTNGSCPSILVEPQRTNKVIYSEQFDNVAWGGVNTTITANNIISPDGTQNADKIEYTDPNNYLITFSSNILNTAYTISCYAKKGTTDLFSLREFFYFGSNARFDLTNGTIVSDTTGTAKIQNVGNGWYRCSITQTYTSLQTNVQWSFDNRTSTGNLYLWGAQIEAGAYATSYIPTVASSVTRNADVISKIGISSLIGQTEGTVFLNINVKNLESYTRRILTLSDNTVDNLIGFQISANLKKIVFYVEKLGANQTVISTSDNFFNLNENVKIAAAYKLNDFVLYVNGTQIGTDTSGTIPSTSVLKFSEANDSAFYTGAINTTALWEERLSNETLATLTTI